jgi:hypothetical protein
LSANGTASAGPMPTTSRHFGLVKLIQLVSILKTSAAMIGDMPLIGDTRVLRFQPGILRSALQEVIFMFRRDPDSGIQRRHPVREFTGGVIVRLEQSASFLAGGGSFRRSWHFSIVFDGNSWRVPAVWRAGLSASAFASVSAVAPGGYGGRVGRTSRVAQGVSAIRLRSLARDHVCLLKVSPRMLHGGCSRNSQSPWIA